ncbi:Calcium-dependent protein kinase 1 (PfCDPK1) [Durusdinium trenchii]|uniref:Calcium-dependent protein kinase 1 (PfCDPK1) n=1 Tax=Durusdinium trenchii TaxID=1381693 RepID=A0ABP0JS89_9DINO
MDLLDGGDGHLSKYKDEVRAIFDSVDEDRSGVIDKAEFVEAVRVNAKVRSLVSKSRMLSGLVASGDLNAAFSSFDTDNGGSVTFDEFWAFCKNEADEDNIRQMFNAIDRDGSRYITKEELVHAFKHNTDLLKLVKHSKVFGKLIEKNDWDKVISEMDTDKSGASENQIDYPEFWKWCKNIAARVQINLMKERARENADKLAASKQVLHQEVLKRLSLHVCRAGAAKGGVFTVSVVPQHLTFPNLKEAPNPHAPRSSGKVAAGVLSGASRGRALKALKAL